MQVLTCPRNLYQILILVRRRWHWERLPFLGNLVGAVCAE